VLLSQISLAVIFVVFTVFFNRKIADYQYFTWIFYVFGILCMFYVPKVFFLLFLFLDKIFFQFTNNHHIAKYGFFISLSFSLLFLYGMIFERYNFQIDNIDIHIANLPQSFDGYKIVHLSDVHMGSFANSAGKFQKAMDMINEQSPDLIVITGDFVNNFASEIVPFIPIFSRLQTADGKFAVLGNHDYGGYHDWKDKTDSIANFYDIKTNIRKMGFTLLNNQSSIIYRNGDSIAIIGVENWGKLKRFPKYADLNKAVEAANNTPTKILLSHDPEFWIKEVKGKTDITLTLSGHTHGMQFGLKIGNKRYNPLFFTHSKFLSGLYQYDNQYIYVNRGIGVIGFAGRIGMPPEITVIRLRK
jgi:predicted MPP superfamily phosphohydrolase